MVSVETRVQRAEVLARALSHRLDKAPDPVELFRAAFGEPDPWQVEALRSRSPRLALNVTRQGGKSSVAAALATHTALGEPGALALVVSPSLHQCLPGREGTIRGYSGVDLLLIDEAARVPAELYYAVRPMLAVSGGRIATLSTPFGRVGWWADAWHSGEPWERYEVPAERCPRIPAGFLEEERRAMPEWFYLQEYGCRFMEAVDAVFRREDILVALSDEVAPLFIEGAA